MMHTAKYMHQILDISLNAYDELFADINLDCLVEKKGIMYVWEKKGIESRKIEINIREKLGVKQKILNHQFSFGIPRNHGFPIIILL